MTKANKTVLIFFAHAYIRIDQTPPLLPVTKCHIERTPSPSLKRDVINEWPLIGCNDLTEKNPSNQQESYIQHPDNKRVIHVNTKQFSL